jgi:hypothetical protein
MKTLTTICILFHLFFNGYSQIKKDTISINISGRVDTTYNADVKEIYHLFKNYLESKPDSIYNNPYWNIREKTLDTLGNPAIFYKSIYNLQMSPKELFKYWKPFVLSIEKKKDLKYLLRIALIKDSNEPDKILTILNLNAIKENNNWVLENTLIDIENSWNTKRYNFIKYVFPNTHTFNDSLAKKAVRFCDSIASLLHITYFDTINFYICNSPDEMGLLFGYEFYYLNYRTGMTNKWLNQIFSAKADEYYPHEFIHLILGSKNEYRNYIIEEGLACFLGELNSIKYKKQIINLAKDYLSNKPSYTLNNLLSNSVGNNGYETAYPTGSIIAEIVYEKKGYAGLRELSDANTNKAEDIYKTIFNIVQLNKVELEKVFRKKLIQYHNEIIETNKK